MKTNKDLIIILPTILVLFIIFFIVMPKVKENREKVDQNQNVNNSQQAIGGQRDEHGCLGPAGYSWNEQATACLREWEITDEESKQAIKIAVEDLEWQNDATIIEVIQESCVGCFIIKLERNFTNHRKTVNLENWEVKKISLTPQECQALGGEPVNIVGGATCAEDEENVGEVTGFISPNICCVPVK